MLNKIINLLKKFKKILAILRKYGILYIRDYEVLIFWRPNLYFNEEETVMFGFFRRKKTNYVKVVLITLAVVAAVALIAFIIYKLVKKYSGDLVYDCDDLLDECDDCDLVIDDAGNAGTLAE